MAQTPEFKDFLPGMEFFQSFLKGAGMPSQFANWVAPTMDVAEIEQKITDLKAVLSWLETHARMTQNMIQALEVQRMTLQALKTMNVDLKAFSQSLVAEPTAAADRPAAADDKAAAPAQEPPQSGAPLFDPMQWWNTLTTQFTDLASKAMQEGGALQAGFAAAQAGASPQPAPGATSGVSTAAGRKTAGKAASKPATKGASKPATKAGRKAAKPPSARR